MDIKRRSSTTNTKTIKTPGSSIERVAQACDRCRAKKTKCDGKKPTCSSCAAIGIQCIVSDRLSRRAFPKGYTETLEERIRQLEAENRRLVGLVDLRDEQLEMANGKGGKGSFNDSLTSSNLSRLQKKLHEDGCPCGCADHPHSLHDRPVSVIGSVHEGGRELASSVNFSDDNDSLVSATDSLAGIRDDSSVSSHTKPLTFGASSEEVDPAPGAFAAATAIAKMQTKHELQNKQQMLTSLVAMSVPRSTEETLFIPTLLAKVCQAYGYNSKPAILAANSLALLKEAPERTPKSKIKDSDVLHKLLMDREDVIRLKDDEASYFITHLLHLPHSRIDLDKLIMVYFSEWGNILPVIDKQTFLKQYDTWVSYLEQGFVVSGNNPPALYDSVEKFGAIIVLVVSLSMLSSGEDEVNVGDSDFNVKSHQLEYFDHLIHEFVRPNCIISRYCSVQSLQILTLALQYCLAIGDLTTCYELRGRAISMAQQLRLHRCPAAVLGISSSTESANIRNFRQGERRILFWCIYCLDVYSSLNLGVPRLLKDFEVECAMPFSGDRDDDDVSESVLVVNNTRLAIVGKVSKLALSYMRYCKVLAGILDAIFSRFDASDFQNEALARDGILESWRRELPSDLKFEIDTNGFSKPSSELSKLSRNQLVLMFLYYHAKILIYLPLISQYGDHHDVMLSAKEKISRDSALQRHSEGKYVPIRPRRKENSEDLRDGLVHEDLKYENLKHEDLKNETLHSASETLMKGGAMIQQSSIQLLECLHASSTEGVNSKVGAVGLPIPLNVSREMARYTLLVAQGSLDYIRGGTLFQHSKQLLLDCLSHMVAESNSYSPGRMKKSSIKLMDLAVLTILDLNVTKAVKKKSPAPARQPVLRPAVDRRGPTSQLANEVINSSSLNGNEPNNQKDTHISRQVSPRQFTPIESKRQTSIKTEVPMNISPTNDNSMNLINDNTNNASNVEYDNYAFENDNIEDILMFDPFKVDFQGMPDEFVTDGSLGLVPFLDDNGSRGFSFDDSLSQRP